MARARGTEDGIAHERTSRGEESRNGVWPAQYSNVRGPWSRQRSPALERAPPPGKKKGIHQLQQHKIIVLILQVDRIDHETTSCNPRGEESSRSGKTHSGLRLLPRTSSALGTTMGRQNMSPPRRCSTRLKTRTTSAAPAYKTTGDKRRVRALPSKKASLIHRSGHTNRQDE